MRIIITLLFSLAVLNCTAKLLRIDDQFVTVIDYPQNTATVAYDLTGNGNNGTIYGAVLTGTNLYFDGVDDYVDTGLYPDDNWQYYIKAKFLYIKTSVLFGVDDGNVNTLAGIKTTRWYVGYGDRNNYLGNAKPSVNETYGVGLSNGFLYINGYIKDMVTNYNWNAQSTNKLYLGALNAFGTPAEFNSFANCIIEDYKCYTNNILIQHFDFTARQKKYIGIK